MTEHNGDETRQELADERTELARERNEMARERTGASSSRTVLANERTFSAWLRTALSAIGVGLAVPRLLAPPEYRHIATSLGLILIVLGVAMGLLAAKRYCRVSAELEAKGLELTPGWVATVVGLVLTLVGVLAIILVIME